MSQKRIRLENNEVKRERDESGKFIQRIVNFSHPKYRFQYKEHSTRQSIEPVSTLRLWTFGLRDYNRREDTSLSEQRHIQKLSQPQDNALYNVLCLTKDRSCGVSEAL